MCMCVYMCEERVKTHFSTFSSCIEQWAAVCSAGKLHINAAIGLPLLKVSVEVCCRCPRFARSIRVRLPKLQH